MRILEAAALVSLRDSFQPRIAEQKVSGQKLAEELFAEAEAREEPFIYHTPETWRRKWLPSREFRLMRIPLNAAALPCEPKGRNLVLKKIHAREDKPILVEYNKNRIGGSLYGFTPEVIVIDGKHRYQAAILRGDTHIMAFVGELAAEVMAVGGGGGGPAPERTTGSPGASLVAKMKKVKAAGSEQTARLSQHSQDTYSAEGKRLKELDVDKVRATGTSEGATKGWEGRSRKATGYGQDEDEEDTSPKSRKASGYGQDEDEEDFEKGFARKHGPMTGPYHASRKRRHG